MKIHELYESGAHGEGWWYNIGTGVIIPIDSGDLGPNGDHDGWITLGDNAERLGVDKEKAAAFQAATYGFTDPTGEFADYHLEGDYVGPAWEYDDPEYAEAFATKFGVTPDEAAHDTTFPELIRVRRWPNGTVTMVGAGDGRDVRAAVRYMIQQLIKWYPTIVDDDVVELEFGGGYTKTTVGALRKGNFRGLHNL